MALLKERSLIGVYWGDSIQHDPAGHLRNLKRLTEWFAARKINPVISDRVSLGDAPAAMAQMIQRRVKGKVVVLPES